MFIFFSSENFSIWAQSDEIILPELNLTIEDQSSLTTSFTPENAILRERNPQFQEVYLEELSVDIADVSLNAMISQQDNNKFSYLQFFYGSFNRINIEAYSQNLINNLFYRVSYQGQINGNVSFNKTIYSNTKRYQNVLDIYFSYMLTDTIIDINFAYEQYKISFIENPKNNQYTYYIPTSLNTKYWVNDISYVEMNSSIGFSILEYQDLEGIKTKDALLIDGTIDFAYKANFTDWNYFEMKLDYWVNDYSSFITSHTGTFLIKSDFLLGKGFGINIGAVLGGSSFNNFFMWPEIAFIYNYLDIFTIDFKISGDYNLYNAEKAAQEEQFFALAPTPEYRWIYSSSIKIIPSPYFWLEGNVSYNDYKTKRIYDYDPNEKLYSFILDNNVDIWSVGISLEGRFPDIFNILVSYYYEKFPKNWLLYSPHKFNILLGLGYEPIGFLFQTNLILYTARNLTTTLNAPLVLLLNFKISQKIYRLAEVFLEVNNVLNQNVQFISGTYYGGIQAYGGLKLNF